MSASRQRYTGDAAVSLRLRLSYEALIIQPLDNANRPGMRQAKDPADLIDRHPRLVTDRDQRSSGFSTRGKGLSYGDAHPIRHRLSEGAKDVDQSI